MKTQLIKRLAAIPNLAHIPEEELQWLVDHGSFKVYEPGVVIGPKGKPIKHLWIIISGNISITVDHGMGPHLVTEWKTGEVSGMLPYSRMSAPPGDNFIKEKSEILSIPVKLFPELIRTCPHFTAYNVHSMLDRARSFNTSEFKVLDKLKSRFFANISHEFRTPLTLILGLLDNFADNRSRIEVEQDVTIMRRNANRLLNLINQLLELSKFEAGSAKLKAQPHNLLAYLKRVATSFASIAETNEIALNFVDKRKTSGEPMVVYFQESKFEKVLLNLLSNALKFTPDGGRIEVVLKQAKNHAVFSVINSGAGIAEDQLPYIFDRFYQGDSSSTRAYEGTGIGLSLVKEIVAIHHGTISVTSKVDVETSFTVKLPLGNEHLTFDEISHETSEFRSPNAELENQNSHFQTPNSPKGLAEFRSPNSEIILVVEDNEYLRHYISAQLRSQYKVIEATNGREGLATAEQEIPDIIISDIMMPEMDGYELCHEIKTNEKTNHIPVIMLTAKAATASKLEGLETGADAYLIKPFNPEELRLRVRNLIKNQEELRKKFSAELLLRPSDVSVPSTQKIFLEKLTSTIEAHIDDENFSVEILGKEIGMSRAQIHRKLRALTNQSASEFIRTFRLHRAAQLIEQGAATLAEIAYKVGFNSQAYFSTTFQTVFGCTPSDYKKRKLGNKG